MSEIVRHAQMSFEEMKTLGFRDFLGPKLTDQNGRQWTLGRAAIERFHELAERAVDDSPYRRRLDTKAAFESILRGYGAEYLRIDRSGTSPEEDRGRLAAWIEAAGQQCETLTHFIPCQIGMKQAGCASIGPVTFGSVENAISQLSGPLQASRDTERERDPQRSSFVTDKCDAYLQAFSDVAQVTVPDCDPPTSRRIAEEAVQAAINTLHLLAGAYPTEDMRAGGPAMASIETASIALKEDGEILLSWKKSWEGAGIHSKFWATLSEPQRAQRMDALSVAISTIINRTDPHFVASRFLDAVAWYSDAVRERSKPAAIVKYLTAMERLLWTGERGPGVTRRLSERTAALCFSAVDWDFEQLEAEVREAYDLRSGIVHGRLSATDPKVMRNHRLCKRVARDLLLTWLDRYGPGFALETSIQKAKMHFDAFVKEVKEETAKRKLTEPTTACA
ncbi:Uncharacterised protein [Brevundimonas diminuta]|uniref:Uncharacterized protein n=2 Tax=Brevundimonas diminuta TaxID=293 RepID=A0A2X1AZ70_BREDI|nr:Uncharacterised protein [Brevundimonas diminuta]